MKNKLWKFLGGALLLFPILPASSAADLQVLRGHVPEAVSQLKLQPISRLPATDRLKMTIGLPLRNREALTNLVQQIYDPTSTNFHRYLTPSQFTARFGPTEEDYQRVLNFAKTNGFDIAKTYGDRVLLDVSAPVATAENTFHVKLNTYQHPTDARQFFAPDVEPSTPPDVPILYVSGLNNFTIPKPLGHVTPAHAKGGQLGGVGSAPDGVSFIGYDFRNAYVPGYGAFQGFGQSVGLVEFAGYYTSDITNYEGLAGNSCCYVPLRNVPLEGFAGPLANTNGIAECSADIELVVAMAPGLSQVVVFEAPTNFFPDPIFSSMVASNGISQFSCSWLMSYDAVAEGYLIQMASQGQSFFMASGDSGAYQASYGNWWPSDDPYMTSVGGTELTMAPHGAAYESEKVWNSYDIGGGISGGGSSLTFGIPPWQVGVKNLTAVGGSPFMRNVPDVAIVATNVWLNYNHTTANFSGTSCGAPLWAAFTALANQYSVSVNNGTVGWLNPALYAIGAGTNYSTCFNDITTGNSTWPGEPNQFYSATGYDLCTGWGTPKGYLIYELSDLAAFLSFPGGMRVVYVDFNYTGTTQNGQYSTPYNTLAKGTNAVAPNGTIVIKNGGTETTTMTISKPMDITAQGGAATVGQ
jgi:subtilase family serine protease